ncbi:MAG: hypothetical protein IJ111_05790 [Eggerthellaceae bacterium]|nr:hypothetical protein [Eggerthellaceae bacterium]
MIPLPKWLLTSTATVRVPAKSGVYGGEYAEPVTIGRVCFQGAASIKATAYQLQAPVKGVLFIDPNVSEGAFEIPAGALVSVDGEVSEATVHECIPVPSAANLHHWEVTLV